jgi:hypothetical protein
MGEGQLQQEKEVEKRNLDIDVSTSTIAQFLYKDDLEDQQTKIKMLYPGFAKKGKSQAPFLYLPISAVFQVPLRIHSQYKPLNTLRSFERCVLNVIS